MADVKYSEWVDAIPSADPISDGDYFVVVQGGVPKAATALQIIEYVFGTGGNAASLLAALITAQTNPGSFAGGDEIFMNRGGSPYKLTPQEVLASVSTLDAATLDGTEEVLVVQAGVAKKATVDDVNAA